MAMSVEEHRSDEVSPADRDAIGRIYEHSFPPDERTDLDELLAAGDREVLLARDRDQVIGFGISIAYRSGFWMLEYMAVDARLRSSGAGRAMLDAWAARAGRADVPPLGLLVEIDDPGAPDADEFAERRLRFYERWGAASIPCLARYVVPDFVSGAPLAVRLLNRPVGGPHPSGDDLRRLLAEIYEVSYPPAPALLDELLANVVC